MSFRNLSPIELVTANNNPQQSTHMKTLNRVFATYSHSLFKVVRCLDVTVALGGIQSYTLRCHRFKGNL